MQLMSMKPAFVSIGLAFSLCVACGGSDGGGNGNMNAAGAGNMNAAGAGNTNAAGAGNTNAAGAANTSTGSFSSGLPADKQLGSLTDAEKAALCQKLSDYFSQGTISKSLEEFTCRSSSALFALVLSGAQNDADLQTACKSAYEPCLSSPVMTSESCKVSETGSTCTATVAEYDACMNDYAKSLDQLITTFPTCDKLTLTSSSQIFALSEPASCQTLQEKCPDAALPGQDSDDTDE